MYVGTYFVPSAPDKNAVWLPELACIRSSGCRWLRAGASGKDGMELAGPAFLNIHVCPASVLAWKQSCCSMTGPILDGPSASLESQSIQSLGLPSCKSLQVLRVSPGRCTHGARKGEKSTKGRLVL